MGSELRNREIPIVVPFVSGHSRARWVKTFLIVVIVFTSVILVPLAIPAAAGVVRDEFGVYGALLGLASVICLLFSLIAVVFFFIWIHRTHRNLPSLGASGLEYSPAWAVSGFFIPLVNLFLPFRVVTEIWKASDPKADISDGLAWKSAPTSPLISYWWALLLILFPVTSIVAWITDPDLAFYHPQPMLGSLVLVWYLLYILAAILAKRLVKNIDTRQEEKHRRTSTAGKTSVTGFQETS